MKAKPQTPLAKQDAVITAKNLKVYPQWKRDAAAFGVRVADYNAGFLAGDRNGRKKSKRSNV